MLCGFVMYIAVFKSEVGSKLRPRSLLQPPAFEYRYGYSFIVYVIGAMVTQFTGILCIFLYIYRTQYKWKRKQYEDFKRGKPVLPVNHNVNHIDSTVIYPCKRHPHAYINSNSAVQYVNQRRYCFTKEMATSPCSIHHNRSPSNSLRDDSSFYNIPPPPSISYHFPDNLNRCDPRNYRIPRDVTTNTVSTTTDLPCDEYLSEQFDDYSPSIQHEHEFVTFDLDQPLPLRAPSIVSISSRKVYDTTETLRRTTPV